MPDIFVPRDTSMNSKFLFELYAKNILREYALRYVNDHKKSLDKQTFEEFLNEFTVSESMLRELVQDAKKAGIKPNDEELARSKPLILAQAKGYIGRYHYGRERKDGLNNEIFQVLNPIDNVYQEALRQFGKAADLERGVFSSLNVEREK